MYKKFHIQFLFFLLTLTFLLGFSRTLIAQKTPVVDPEIFQSLSWRNIGPAIMGGRLTDIEGIPGKPEVLYVASASGGLWKTVDGGITWKPIFDRMPVQSIGDIALAPSNPEIVWVGTGEDNPRNSTSFGVGVFKSTDGGKTWKYMGLKETERISRILINPHNPDIVYVAAIGHIYGPNPNRGVYMTTDGGKTWKKVLYIDEFHGASDLEINPVNPNILYAGMWYFQRKPWDFDSGDDRGGVFRSIDGGKTWKKLTSGLPSVMGRIGIKVAPSNPDRVYVIVEAKEGALYRSEDGGDHFRLIHKGTEIVSRGFYYTELRVDPENENRVYAIASPLWVSEDGGKTFKRIARRIHGDFHTMWIDPKNPERIAVGNDGGLAISYNRGKTWEFVNNITVSQFYQISADNRVPFYYVCGGLQDNGSWCGPSRTRGFPGILNDHWYKVGEGDGFFVVPHPKDPWIYLVEYQGGGISRVNVRTGEVISNSPYSRRNDGGPAGELKYRFDWDAPIVQSPHDPMTVYFAGNVVFKSTDFGLTWVKISPDLTTNDPEKLKAAGGPIFPESTTAEYHCTIISLAESPVKPGVIWVGTDDGNLQLTLDGGQHWQNVVGRVKGIKPETPVSHVEPSRVSPAIAYVAFDRHMFDDFSPYIFVTRDYGRTWKKITDGLPYGAYVHVVKEDPGNPEVLYAGTELGLFVSWDKGRTWKPLRMKNLPPVAVHDILIHPRENDLILGTHGRGIWIFDDATPVQRAREASSRKFYLFQPRPAMLYSPLGSRYAMGDKPFVGPNPPYGALIYYYLKDKPQNGIKATLQVYSGEGKLIREIRLKPHEGVNLAVWDLGHEPAKVKKGSGGWRSLRGGPRVLPGKYTVKVKIGSYEMSRELDVRMDPAVKYNLEDLRKLSGILLELRDMVSTVTGEIETLESVERQLKSLLKTAEELYGKVPDDCSKAIKDKISRAGELKYKLTRREKTYASEYYWGESNKLIENLMGLMWEMQVAFRAPTEPQMQFLDELKVEHRKLREEIKKFLEKDIVELNSMLRQRKLPPVVFPELK